MPQTDASPRSRSRWAAGVVVALTSLGGSLSPTVLASSPPGSTTPDSSSSDDPLAPQPLPELTEVTVAVPFPLENFADVLLGAEFGEYERENLDVNVEFVPIQEAFVLLDRGDVDVAQGAMNAGLLNLIAGGGNVRWALPQGANTVESGNGFYFNEEAFGGELSDPESWRGQRILTPSGIGSVSAWYLWRYLESLGATEGLRPTDLSWELISTSDAPTVLINDGAPLAYLSSPFQLQVAEDDCCEYLDGVFPESVTLSGWIYGPTLLENREVGDAFARATARMWRDHLHPGYKQDAEIVAALAEILDAPVDDLAALPELSFSLPFDNNVANLDAQDFWFEAGEVLSYGEPLTVEDVYDLEFVEALAGDG